MSLQDLICGRSLVSVALNLVAKSLNVEVGHSFGLDDVVFDDAEPALLRGVQFHGSLVPSRLEWLLGGELLLADLENLVFCLRPVLGFQGWTLVEVSLELLDHCNGFLHVLTHEYSRSYSSCTDSGFQVNVFCCCVLLCSLLTSLLVCEKLNEFFFLLLQERATKGRNFAIRVKLLLRSLLIVRVGYQAQDAAVLLHVGVVLLVALDAVGVPSALHHLVQVLVRQFLLV